MSNKHDLDSQHIHSAFQGVRRENLLSCFSALCERAPITRAELAAATDLSIMTTGKIADAMTEAGVLIEQKQPSACVGRRPGTLRFNDTPLFLILNVSSRRFTAHVLSPAMTGKTICMHDYNDIFPFDDNLLIFLNAVKRSCNTSKEAIFYLAVITAPRDDKRQCITRAMPISPRSEQHMLDYIARIMHRTCDLVLDEISATQYYFNSLSAFKNVDCGAYISLSDMTYAAVWMRGNLLSPRVCRIGELMLPERKRIADALADAHYTEDATEPVAYAIGSLDTFFSPDTVVLESSRFRINEVFLEGVYRELSRIQPFEGRIIPLHIAEAEPSAAICGCGGELRRKWFYNLAGLE